MEGKEKMVQIYEVMADITLARLEKIKEAEAILGEDEIQLVSATLQLYNFIADESQPKEMLFTPTDSGGTKYSAESIGIPCPLTDTKAMETVGNPMFNY